MPPRLRVVPNHSILPQISLCKLSSSAQPSRAFRTSPQCQESLKRVTLQRREMWQWLRDVGKNFVDPLPGSSNYLGAYTAQGELRRSSQKSEDGSKGLAPERDFDLVPFPLNMSFRSHPVVDEDTREAIWLRVMRDGQSVKKVSVDLGIETSRVGAIVRLKEVEKTWIRKGKRLAKPYARAVMEMLPKTNFSDNQRYGPKAHESINDLPVHGATIQQIFYPTSESREFTREDAANVFDGRLLPAEKRIPHPEMVEMEKERMAGVPYAEIKAAALQREEEVMQKKLIANQQRREREEKALKVVSGKRWDFRFREVSVDEAGADGRGYKGVGWRYGVPNRDRKRGEVKIPTRVE